VLLLNALTKSFVFLTVVLFLSPVFSAGIWWDSNWEYRKAITVTDSSGSDLTDFQVLVEFDSQSLVSAGKMNLDCSDLRFSDVSGAQGLSYWLDSGCNTANTKAWVKVPSIPASSSTDIHMYYGNPVAVSASSGPGTFEFFDDFSSSLDWTNKWVSNNHGLYSVSGGLLALSDGGFTFSDCLNSQQNFSNGYAIEARLKVVGTEPCELYLGSEGSKAQGTSKEKLSTRIDDNFALYVGGGATKSATDPVSDTWYRGKLWIPSSGSATVKAYADDDSTQLGELTGTPIYTTGHIFLHQRPSSTGYVDWIYVRKYTSPEPATTISSEQSDRTYSFRKAITIDNTGGSALTDYQVKVENPVYDETGLVASWHMDGTSGTSVADASGNQHSGTAAGNFSRDSGGKHGYCGYFDGATSTSASRVSVPYQALPTITGTISMWVKRDGVQTTGYDPGLFMKQRAMNYSVGLAVEESGADINKVKITDNYGSVTSLYSAQPLADGVWTHVAVAWDISSTKLYIDGVEDAVGGGTFGFPAGNYSEYIGAWYDEGDNNIRTAFNGFIDEVRIYNRALSPDEIKAHYDANAKPNYDDIRFTDSASFEESEWAASFPYWQEKDGTFWVKVPEIPADDTKTIYAYYGNDEAESASDGDAVFEFFDDFENEDAWTDINSKWAVSDGVYNGPATHEDMTATTYVTGSSYADLRLRAKLKVTGGSDYVALAFRRQSGTGELYWLSVRDSPRSEMDMLYWNGSSNSVLGHFASGDVTSDWNIVETCVSGNSAKVWLNGNYKTTVDLGSKITGAGQVGLAAWDYGPRYADEFFVAKCASAEPVLSVGGEEQSGRPCVTGVSFDPISPESRQSVTVAVSASDPQGPEDISSYTFIVKKPDSSVFEGPVTQAGNTYSFVPDEGGYWSVGVTATDGDGHTSNVYSEQVQVVGWWNSNWRYRQPITINENSGSDLTDYGVLVEFDSQSLISSGAMKDDCGDLRFADMSGIQELSYWIESGCNTPDTKVRVEIPVISGDSSSVVYMYYGNALADSASLESVVFGSDVSPAGKSCTEVRSNGSSMDGVYWIDPDGVPFQVYCDMSLDGGGWTFVIRNDDVGGWASWNYNLQPNHSSGTYVPDITASSDFYMNFSGISYDEVLLSTGDYSHWLITYPSEIVCCYSNALKNVKKSSQSASPTQYRWYFRSANSEDPWISVGNHVGVIVYGEYYAGSPHIDYKNAHQGANVFVRNYSALNIVQEPTVILGDQEQEDGPFVTGVLFNPASLEIGQSVTATATADDPQGVGTIESYSFTVKSPGGSIFAGPVTPAGSEYSFTPDVAGTWAVEVTVVDVDGHESSVFSESVIVSGWWGSDWLYRKPITMAELSGSDLTDFQVLVEFDSESLVSAGAMCSDCSDLRFTDVSGTHELSYWIESGCNTADTKVWVKVPSIPANGSTDIYMYYGNPVAGGVSNGMETFDFFDDFENYNAGDLNGQGGWVGQNDIDVQSSVVYGGLKAASHDGYPESGINKAVDFDTGILKVRMRRTSGGSRTFVGESDAGNNYLGITMHQDGHFKYQADTGRVNLPVDTLWSANVWYEIELAFDTVNDRYPFIKISGQVKGNDLPTSAASSIDKVRMSIGYDPSTGQHYWDDILIRKYASSEPAVGLGAQEQFGAPVITDVSLNLALFELGDAVEAAATAIDPNGDPIVQYDFRVLDGLGNEILNPAVQSSGSYSFTAVGEPGLWQIKAKASDGTYWGGEFTEVVFVNDSGLATVSLSLSDGAYSDTELSGESVVLSGTQSSGSFTTPAIDPVNFSKWGVITFSKTTPGNSILTVDVLKASDDNVLISNVQNGQNISATVGSVPIKLKANFTSGSTPSLDSWDVSYYSRFKITVTDCSALYSGEVTAEAVRVSDSEEFGPFTGAGGQVFVVVPPGIYNIQACIPANGKCSWKYNVELA